MWQSALLSYALLQLYYAGMALYGWWRWQQIRQRAPGERGPVYEWRWQYHAILIGITALVGWGLARWTLRPRVTLEKLQKERARREAADGPKS